MREELECAAAQNHGNHAVAILCCYFWERLTWFEALAHYWRNCKKYSYKKRKAVQTSYDMLYWPDFLFLVFCHVIYVWSGVLLSRHTFTTSLTVDIVILSLFPGKAFTVEFKKVAFTSRWHYWYADYTLASVLHLTGVRNKKNTAVRSPILFILLEIL